jgi:sugar-specific transcriptional regulator TrmB
LEENLSEGKKLSEIKVANVYRVVKSLINKGLVEKVDEEYKIIDPILSFYLRK